MHFPLITSGTFFPWMWTALVAGIWLFFAIKVGGYWRSHWRGRWRRVRAMLGLAPKVPAPYLNTRLAESAKAEKDMHFFNHIALIGVSVFLCIGSSVLYSRIQSIQKLNRLTPDQVAEIQIFELDPKGRYRLDWLVPIKVVSDSEAIRGAFIAINYSEEFQRWRGGLSNARAVRFKMKDPDEPVLCIWTYTQSEVRGDVNVVELTGYHSSPAFLQWIDAQLK